MIGTDISLRVYYHGLFRPSKAELASPGNDWELSWFLARQPGIPPELTSFLWKMLLNLLSTQQRLHRVGASVSPLCKLCKTETGSHEHELIDCSYNSSIGLKLLSTLQTYIPSMTPTSLLLLNLSDLETVKQLPVSLLIGSTLSCIWIGRTTYSRVCAYTRCCHSWNWLIRGALLFHSICKKLSMNIFGQNCKKSK